MYIITSYTVYVYVSSNGQKCVYIDIHRVGIMRVILLQVPIYTRCGLGTIVVNKSCIKLVYIVQGDFFLARFICVYDISYIILRDNIFEYLNILWNVIRTD